VRAVLVANTADAHAVRLQKTLLSCAPVHALQGHVGTTHGGSRCLRIVWNFQGEGSFCRFWCGVQSSGQKDSVRSDGSGDGCGAQRVLRKCGGVGEGETRD